MTRAELLATLKRLAEASQHNPGRAHEHADEALMAYIADTEITTAYEGIKKWYA